MTHTLGVVVSQRDCYDWPEPLIEALLQAVPAGTPVLFIDGGSPPAVGDSLRKSAEHWGFQLERRQGFIGANQARLLALERLSVTHLLCVENDVLLAPSCARYLLAAAERHQADVVVPLVLEENSSGRRRIHVAGGAAVFVGAGAASGWRCGISSGIRPRRSDQRRASPPSWWNITH
jgi:hypothetical protein